jgi:hypothetical protein
MHHPRQNQNKPFHPNIGVLFKKQTLDPESSDFIENTLGFGYE